jgi:hypothetical protein
MIVNLMFFVVEKFADVFIAKDFDITSIFN